MNVAITGASGFIGRAVAGYLRNSGHTVRAISLRGPLAPDALAGANAVIHLAGEPVAQRWTAAARDKILRSRVEGTRALVAGMRAQPPQALISASAVGYYGSQVPTYGAEKPNAPVMLHFGADDHHIPRNEVESKVGAVHPEVPIFFYEGAGHAFNNDDRPSYNAAAAQLARERSLDFLKKHLVG